MSEKILKNWKPTETRLKNIERKVRILDRDTQFYKGVPIPSWIELSVIDACNRIVLFVQNQMKILLQIVIKK